MEMGYIAVADDESASIHDDALSERFDRCSISPGLKPDVESAEAEVGGDAMVDSVTELVGEDLPGFDPNVSDHLAVTLTLDVSEEHD